MTQQVFITAKLPVDLNSEDAQKYLVNLQRVLKPGCVAVGNIDQDTKHCKEVFVRDSIPSGELRPRFDFEYTLKDFGKYNAMSWAGAEISYEEAMFYYSLVLMLKPLTVIETGTGVGLSTVHIAQALVDNQKGELYTIEIDPNRITGSVGMLNAFGFKEQVSVISQHSIRVLKEWTRPVDIAFLDTTALDGQQEFDALAPHMKADGVIVSRYPLQVPANLWRRLELFGARNLWIYQKGAAAGFDGPRLTEVNVGFKPEQADWAKEAPAAETPARKPARVVEVVEEPARKKTAKPQAKVAAKSPAKPAAKKGTRK